MSVPAPLVRVWDAAGVVPLGVLTELAGLSLSEVLSEPGSLTVQVPRSAAGLLDVDGDRQVEVLWPTPSGPRSSWWVLDDDDGTWVSDDVAGEVLRVTCRDLWALLGDALVVPDGGVGAVPAEWAWTDATPGRVVADVWAAAQARGCLAGCTLAGGAAVDASGVAWPEMVTVTHRAGATLAAVVTALVEARLLEVRWVGRALELHRPGGGMDREVDVVLRPGRDVESAPWQRSRRAVATSVLVEGDGGETVLREQVLPGRRRREASVSESSLAGAALQAAGDLWLGAHAAADVQVTHDLADVPDGPVPWVDYAPGDRVVTRAAGPVAVRRRIAQVAVEVSPGQVRVSLELGSLLRSAEEAVMRRMARLRVDGAVS